MTKTRRFGKHWESPRGSVCNLYEHPSKIMSASSQQSLLISLAPTTNVFFTLRSPAAMIQEPPLWQSLIPSLFSAEVSSFILVQLFHPEPGLPDSLLRWLCSQEEEITLLRVHNALNPPLASSISFTRMIL